MSGVTRARVGEGDHERDCVHERDLDRVHERDRIHDRIHDRVHDRVHERDRVHARVRHRVRALALLLAATLAASFVGGCASPRDEGPARLRVMAFNLWHGGDAGGVGVDGLAAVVRAGAADLVGVQEGLGWASAPGEPRPVRSAELAEALGFHHLALDGGRAILSRHPIAAASRAGHGALIETPWGEVALYCVHFAHAPYQPYQLVGIEYHGGAFLETADEAIAAARAARGTQIIALLDDVVRSRWDVPTFVVGDFNEPSHLDWTAAAVEAGLVPLAVEWPSTRALTTAGFVDGYRALAPDASTAPGHTWTPLTAPDDPSDRHDRIDLVLARRATPIAAQVVGESAAYADLVVTPYPSDHRAVVVEWELERER